MSALEDVDNSVAITFVTKRMPNSTELRRLRRSIEWAYYALLFTSEAAYKGRDEVWLSWAQMGFGTAIQVGPPDAERADRIDVSTYSDGKTLTFTVEARNSAAAESWLRLLRAVDAGRLSSPVVGESDRLAALERDAVIRELLAQPVTEAIASLPETERSRIEHAMSTSLLSLTYPTIEQVSIVESATASS